MRHDAPPSVKLPTRDEDKPGWGKVGIIAAVGFVIGVAWPKVVGVRLGPSAPGESQAAAAASATPDPAAKGPVEPTKAEAPKAVASSAPASPAKAQEAPRAEGTTVTVGRGSVLTCKTESGDAKKGKECGALAALDALVTPRLRKLVTCAGAEGSKGKLSVVVTADFTKSRVTHDIGKSSTVEAKDALATCVKTELAGLTLDKIAHEHPRYVVGYNAVFAPRVAAPAEAAPAEAEPAAAKAAPLEKPSAAKEPVKEATGEAQVVWDVALVRDVPRTGQIVARLPRGSKVRLGAGKDGWFAVKFGDALDKDGWLYRGAVGR